MKVIVCLLVVFAFYVAVKGLTALSKYNFQTSVRFPDFVGPGEKNAPIPIVHRLFSHHMITNRGWLSGTYIIAIYRSREVSLDLLDISQYLHIALQPVVR